MAADVLFLEYPKCSTCQKAKKWLDAHGVTYADPAHRGRQSHRR